MSKVKEFCSFHDVSIEMDRFLSKGVHFKKWLLSIANYLDRHRNLQRLSGSSSSFGGGEVQMN
jgi:hypothetical protein